MTESAAGMDYFEAIRESYTRGGLTEAEASADPLEQFRRWMDEAIRSGIREANAMTLATNAPDGYPDARVVLLKDLSPAGFSFFTNRQSAKGRQLAASPRASLVFFWRELERQVRIMGDVVELSREESEKYFVTRPRGSQLSAWASEQSEVVAGRETLEGAMASVEERYANADVPLPPHWGGYRLSPRRIEFWQGRPNRLHDRLSYRKNETNEWIIERLSP